MKTAVNIPAERAPTEGILKGSSHKREGWTLWAMCPP
jgi:hypothetical protein